VSRNALSFAALLLVSTAGCESHTEPVASPTLVSSSSATLETLQTEMAITVDDLPIHGPETPGLDRMTIAERFLTAFRRHGVRSAYGFVNGKRVTDDPSSEAILRRWRDAGHPLGNHTYSHLNLNAVGLTEYLADLEKGEEVLKRLEPDAGVWKMFRYPFLREGDTPEKRSGVRRYLRGHGYTIAPVTIDADDWMFNAPFVRCTAQNDATSLAKLRQTFIDVHVDELRRMRELSRMLVQREVRQVLLLHIGVSQADAVEDLLTVYEKQGVKWIDLRTALADPMYDTDPGDVARYGAALPYRLAKTRGLPSPPPTFARTLEDDLARTCPTKQELVTVDRPR
jgi:peptidoglycan/xylan/chitin deacetylase (PgdA/CDA1 family)